jgi:hypothetical protein
MVNRGKEGKRWVEGGCYGLLVSYWVDHVTAELGLQA